jgi:hypothetical protein
MSGIIEGTILMKILIHISGMISNDVNHDPDIFLVSSINQILEILS